MTTEQNIAQELLAVQGNLNRLLDQSNTFITSTMAETAIALIRDQLTQVLDLYSDLAAETVTDVLGPKLPPPPPSDDAWKRIEADREYEAEEALQFMIRATNRIERLEERVNERQPVDNLIDRIEALENREPVESGDELTERLDVIAEQINAVIEHQDEQDRVASNLYQRVLSLEETRTAIAKATDQ